MITEMKEKSIHITLSKIKIENDLDTKKVFMIVITWE